MKKRLPGMILAGAMAVSLLSGCGGAAATAKKEVTITVKVPALTMSAVADPEITIAYEFLTKAAEDFHTQYQDANVTVNVIEFAQEDETKAIPDTLGTDQAPDVVYAGYFNISIYIHTGYVVPVDDIITDEIRSDIDQSWWDSSSLNGKTYMLPFLGLENVLSYNKKMFLDAGLEKYVSDNGEVQNWSVDEWNEILTALRASLPAEAYPMMMYAGDNQGDTHIMTLLRMFGCEFFDADGHFNIESPEGLQALQWIRDGLEAGWFPQNAENLVSNDAYNQFIMGNLAICFCNSALESNYANAVGGAENYGFVNFPSVNGTGNNTTFITGFQVYDNGDADKLAAAKAFVKYIYESDYLDYCAGGLPASKKTAAKYAAKLAGIQKYINVSSCNVNFTGNQPNWRGVRAAFYPHMQELLYGEKDIETIAKELDADCNAAIDEGYANSTLHE